MDRHARTLLGTPVITPVESVSVVNRGTSLLLNRRRTSFSRFPKRHTLNIRHFQMAFRNCVNFPAESMPQNGVDLDETVQQTCNNAGLLKIVWNGRGLTPLNSFFLWIRTVPWPYSELCNQLFAAHQSNHFKDLKVYYFHNCIYEHSIKIPPARNRWVDTEWVFNNYDSEYRLILVGYNMAPSELMKPGQCRAGLVQQSPRDRLAQADPETLSPQHLAQPIPKDHWPYKRGAFTINKISEISLCLI